MTPLDRFLASIAVAESGCWLWTRPLHPSGYGRLSVCGRNIYAHVFAYTCWVGDVPEGMELDHRCRVRHCANPDHIEAVTPSENQSRGNNGSRRLVCNAGHWVLGDNVRWYRGRRLCRQCDRDKQRRYYAANRKTLAAAALRRYHSRKDMQ